MLLISPIPSKDYSEITQQNPLRWVILHRKGNNLFPKSGWFKCKDFLNDVVAKRKLNFNFKIYGFSNNFEQNKTGLYLGFKNVRGHFKDNLKLLNKFLEDRGFPKIKRVIQHDEKCSVEQILFIPEVFLNNTFYISFLSSLLRSINQDYPVINYKDNDWTLQDTWIDIEPLFYRKYEEFFNKYVFKNYQYSGLTSNLTDKDDYIHNCGIETWSKQSDFIQFRKENASN